MKYEFPKLLSCSHRTCEECLRLYFKTRVIKQISFLILSCYRLNQLFIIVQLPGSIWGVGSLRFKRFKIFYISLHWHIVESKINNLSQISTGSTNITCPNPGCYGTYTPKHVKMVLRNDHLHNKYQGKSQCHYYRQDPDTGEWWGPCNICDTWHVINLSASTIGQ